MMIAMSLIKIITRADLNSKFTNNQSESLREERQKMYTIDMGSIQEEATPILLYQMLPSSQFGECFGRSGHLDKGVL